MSLFGGAHIPPIPQRLETKPIYPGISHSSRTFTPKQAPVKLRFSAKKPLIGLLLGLGLLGIGIYLGANFGANLNVNPQAAMVSPATLAPIVPTPTEALPIMPVLSRESREMRKERASRGTREAAEITPNEKMLNTPEKPELSVAKKDPLKNLVHERKDNLRIHPELLRAYEFLTNNQWIAAQKSYQSVLHDDAANMDALLGLASALQHQGKLAEARRAYEQALIVDPNEATALAGLLLVEGVEGVEGGERTTKSAENQLKEAIARDPLLALPHFALGNLYVQELRWQEAQQAFFEAFSIEPDNADYVFNMAVSLDHLHQQKLALRYYLSALALSENAPFKNAASFSQAQVRTRISELEQ